VPTATDTPEPTPAPEDTPVPTPTPQEEEEAVVPVTPEPPVPVVDVEDWKPGAPDLLIALVAAAAAGGFAFYLTRMSDGSVSHALRAALWCLVGGLVLYVGYVLYAPSAAWLSERSSVWTAGWVALVGGGVPLVVLLVIARLRQPAPS
jgi:hypothetical protein